MQNQISSNWQKVKLRDVVKNFDFKRVPLSSMDRSKRKGNIPYYGASGIIDYIDDYLFDGDYLLISEDGENLKSRNTPIVFLTSGKFWINNHAHIVKAENDFDNKLIFYWFTQNSISPYITGSAQPKLNQDNLNSIELLWPTEGERKRMAEVFSAFDDKIEVNNKIAKTLEEMAQAFFKEWFVKFKFPGYEKAEFMDSELGKIPKGWRMGILANVVNIRNGFAFKSGDYTNKGIPVIRTMNFTDNESVVLDDIVYLSEEIAKSYKNFYLEKFDLLLVMVGASIGKYVLVPSNILPALQNQNMWDFKPKKEEYRFFNIQLLKRLIKEQRNSATGSARDFFRKDYFYSLNTFIPDEEIIKKFNLVVEPIYEKIDRILGENQKLSALRDLLLPKLMKGEIRI